MPVQQISVKNTADIESFEWVMSGGGGGAVPPRLGSGSSHTSYSNSSGDICRICHCESDAHNPLLAPCYCSGSLKYVHQSCLQQWLTASGTRSCELCKFNFIMHTKIKPFNEWRLLEMSGVERRRLCCAVLFHCVAALCVMWSLFVLIERAVEEVNRGLIAWPFWTKLVVVAVGCTGGAVFMYIQCRTYLQLCNRWRAHNRILLIQNAPDKLSMAPPSPVVHHIPMHSVRRKRERSGQGQVVANIETGPHSAGRAAPSPRLPRPSPPPAAAAAADEDESGGFETYTFNPYRRVSSVNENRFTKARTPDALAAHPRDPPDCRRFSDSRLGQGFEPLAPTIRHVDELSPRPRPRPPPPQREVYHIAEPLGAGGGGGGAGGEGPSFERPQVSDIEFAPDPLEYDIREMLELDARSSRRERSAWSLTREPPPPCHAPPARASPAPLAPPPAHAAHPAPPAHPAHFKSLPNLSASCEHLLPGKASS